MAYHRNVGVPPVNGCVGRAVMCVGGGVGDCSGDVAGI